MCLAAGTLTGSGKEGLIKSDYVIVLTWPGSLGIYSYNFINFYSIIIQCIELKGRNFNVKLFMFGEAKQY